MKISKKAWVIVGIGIIIILLATVYTLYFQEAGERAELEERLSTAQKDLPTLINEREKLEDQLTQAESLLDTNLAQFPESVESIEYGEYLFEIADDCNVNLASLNFPKPTGKTVGGVTYSVVSLRLPVSGELSAIFDFIDVLRTDERFASTEVKGINMAMGGGGAAATINVDIYGYKYKG